jgi:pantoate--beta-alanine ligase
MREWSNRQRCAGRRLAFVPTMGFLHDGHLSLVRDGRARGDLTVVSIFVNPTQFTPSEDFAAYPRDFRRDKELLEREGVDILFFPPAQEVYPHGYQTHVEVEKLGAVLCGEVRPGHFRGVATVVTKLFNIVQPHVAVFGEKDYQQLQLIRHMVRDLSMEVEIVGHPIVREIDGLAMSSRNAYLDPRQRKAAVCLWRSLSKAETMVEHGETEAQAIVRAVSDELGNEPLARVEYVKMCDLETLQEIEQIRDRALLALAVKIGKARLIDNKVLSLKKENPAGGRGDRKNET